MTCLPSKRRPHYSPEARLRILALKAARCWSLAAVAARFQITSATVASWVSASTEAGSTLLRQRDAVNPFPEFVSSIVQQLKATVPMLGRRKVAEYLDRAGLALSASTVARMLKEPRTVPPPPEVSKSSAAVEAMKPAGKKARSSRAIQATFGAWTSHLCRQLASACPGGLGFCLLFGPSLGTCCS